MFYIIMFSEKHDYDNEDYDEEENYDEDYDEEEDKNKFFTIIKGRKKEEDIENDFQEFCDKYEKELLDSGLSYSKVKDPRNPHLRSIRFMNVGDTGYDTVFLIYSL